MKHESEPSGDILDVGRKMGEAACWFVFLLPMGFLLAMIYVALVTS